MASNSTGSNTLGDIFLVLGNDDALNAGLDAPRKKRPHRKSRLGCIACKQRRVKCDEKRPCSHCARRNEKCVRPALYREEAISPPLASPKLETTNDPQINMLHLELFSHFEKQTLPTLSFAEVWPTLMRHAFHEEYVMSTILCAAAKHLAVLSPENLKYSHASAQLLPKVLRLLRQSLSHPFTKQNADALVGSSFLLTYISWCDVEFLGKQRLPEPEAPRLDLSQDQLFLLGPGALQVYFQAVPIFIEEDSAFIATTSHRPRLNIERALKMRGGEAAKYVEPFMKLWDDPKYQTHGERRKDEPDDCAPQSWIFLMKVEAEIMSSRLVAASEAFQQNEMPSASPKELATALARLANPNMPFEYSSQDEASLPESDTPRSKISSNSTTRGAYERILRRLSPVFCCLASLVDSQFDVTTDPSILKDLQRVFYAFPVLCCWPLVDLMAQGDSRALVVLFHFYHAARVLLVTKESWWAHERSKALESLILRELKARGLGVCLRNAS